MQGTEIMLKRVASFRFAVVAWNGLMASSLAIGVLAFGAERCWGQAQPTQCPKTVQELYADFDPSHESLETVVVREWEKEEIVFRYVTFHVGTFLGKPARMAGFFAFPKGKQEVPGLLHLHGGGQRAFLHEVEFYAKRGYACLSINWGGREMEEARRGDPNTDWGGVDPTQNNVPGYFNLKPTKGGLDGFESPRNNNWYLLTLGARRGLTFLEEQSQVDPHRLGVYGHSMGGNLTVYVAGCDRRVRVAAPSVGGSGFRNEPWPLIPEQSKQLPNGDVALFNATLGFESYATQIYCPLLWLGSTNDFHGIMDDTYRTGELIPHSDVRYAFAPHLNHRFTPPYSVTRALWLDQHLHGGSALPSTPKSVLELNASDHIPVFRVIPERDNDVVRVEIYYSVDPHPQARFWRSATVVRTTNEWRGALPLMTTEQPLFAFANVFYECEKTESEPYGKETEVFAISSDLHTIEPSRLRDSSVIATDSPSKLIDDFSSNWQDWYLLAEYNPHHWEYSTRKLNDPKWRGSSEAKLCLDVSVERDNELIVVLTENFFRSYRGPMQEYVARVPLRGTGTEAIKLLPSDFQSIAGVPLLSWQNVDLLSFRAYYEKDNTLIGSKQWEGKKPAFQRLFWE
jgi:dienelactone hydrolase